MLLDESIFLLDICVWLIISYTETIVRCICGVQMHFLCFFRRKCIFYVKTIILYGFFSSAVYTIRFLPVFESNTIWLSLAGTSIFWKWCFFCMDVCKTPSTLADTPLVFLACVNISYLLISCVPSSLQAIDTLLMCRDPFPHPLSTLE